MHHCPAEKTTDVRQHRSNSKQHTCPWSVSLGSFIWHGFLLPGTQEVLLINQILHTHNRTKLLKVNVTSQHLFALLQSVGKLEETFRNKEG